MYDEYIAGCDDEERDSTDQDEVSPLCGVEKNVASMFIMHHSWHTHSTPKIMVDSWVDVDADQHKCHHCPGNDHSCEGTDLLGTEGKSY